MPSMIFYEIGGRNPNEVAASPTTATGISSWTVVRFLVSPKEQENQRQRPRPTMNSKARQLQSFQDVIWDFSNHCTVRCTTSWETCIPSGSAELSFLSTILLTKPEPNAFVSLQINTKLLFQSLISKNFPPAAGQKVAKKKLQKLFAGQQTSSM